MKKQFIKLIKTGNKLLKDSSKMKERFKTVINNVHDGLIAINKENKSRSLEFSMTN